MKTCSTIEVVNMALSTKWLGLPPVSEVGSLPILPAWLENQLTPVAAEVTRLYHSASQNLRNAFCLGAVLLCLAPSVIPASTNTTSGASDTQRQTRYYYDKNDRLVGAEYDNGQAIFYKYDGNGNIVEQAYLSRSRDTNGLPILWKYINGLTNSTPDHDTYGDANHNGWSNYEEWKAGANPVDPSSVPDIFGLSGTNLARLQLPFAPTNFHVATGDLNGLGNDEIVVGADGNPNGAMNSLLILTQTSAGWTAQRLDLGPVGVTSLAVGQPTNREVPAIYAGLRRLGGAGSVVEIRSYGGSWQTNTIAVSTDDSAFVLGVRPGIDVLASFSPSTGPAGGLFGLSFSNGWTTTTYDASPSRKGTLGTLFASSPAISNYTSLRLLAGSSAIQVAGGAANNSSGITIPEPAAANRINWRGVNLASGYPRVSQTAAASVFYAFVDDKNASGQIDAGDDLVITEYQIVGANATQLTLVRQPIGSNQVAQSYGLASLNYLNSTNEVFFTAEPDGQIFSWTATDSTSGLQRRLFSSQHRGKAWHSLSSVRTLEPGEGLVGLRVDPANTTACDIILWPPQTDLWRPVNLSISAPTASLLPPATADQINVSLANADGNDSQLELAWSLNNTTWNVVPILSIDGLPSRKVSAPPTGAIHAVVWNAAAIVGANSVVVYLRARATDVALTGNWSAVTTNLVTIGPGQPVALDDATNTVENVPVDIYVLANDKVQLPRALSVATVTPGLHGDTAINPAGTIRYSPAMNFYGQDNFTYTVSDGAGGKSTALVRVIVAQVNQPPAVSVPGLQTADENTAINIQGITVSDGDAGNGLMFGGSELGIFRVRRRCLLA